jgi:alkanesulfonate monooxygenase SsuD/methylene tetrahydromethanopterin reductase-like flavin-dependent oxidoreductase (luciferase family)
MRLGLFMMPVHPAARSFTDTLAEDTEKSLLADTLGFDELWLGEHFSASTEPIPSPLMFFARLLPLTKHVTFGTAVINLPNHHPAIVAAEVAQFDHMSRGRFMLGIGPGGLASDFELFEVGDAALRGRKFLEAITWLRHHAEAVPAAPTADLHLDRQPRFVVRAPRGRARLGHHLGQHHADLFDRLALDGLQRSVPGRRPAPARGRLARVAQRDGRTD